MSNLMIRIAICWLISHPNHEDRSIPDMDHNHDCNYQTPMVHRTRDNSSGQRKAAARGCQYAGIHVGGNHDYSIDQ